ncbi:MAG: hypothetical protein V1753_09370 [Pseudomonadota bacterium]
MGYWGYPQYVSVGEKRAKAARKLEQLKKKNPGISPILIEGNAIAKTWWGKSWNSNLERYADYSNRIGRGRSYVRNGAVLNLTISPGHVESLVQGSQSKPYSITIDIKKIPPNAWQEITNQCQGKLDSLQELLMGRFPKALAEIFMAQEKGLFPSPKEIKFSCSCPDWADMCKHVAATLYGIGARLDENPNLFFLLRQVDVNELISQAVADKTLDMLKKAGKKSARVMDDVSLSDVFGIDLENAGDIARSISSSKAQITSKPSIASLPEKRASKKQTNIVPEIEVVAKTIQRSKKGIDVTALQQKTGLERSKIYSILQKLKKQGRIKSLARGVYVKG